MTTNTPKPIQMYVIFGFENVWQGAHRFSVLLLEQHEGRGQVKWLFARSKFWMSQMWLGIVPVNWLFERSYCGWGGREKGKKKEESR